MFRYGARHTAPYNESSTAIQETEDTDAMQQLKAGDEGLRVRRVRHRNVRVTGPKWTV
jgi:hypothetical protein